MAGTGLPQNFDQTDFAEGLWGGPTVPAPVVGPPTTSLSGPDLVATPVDHIPVTWEIPSGLAITATWDFTRLLAPGETISGFAVVSYNSLITVITSISGAATVSSYMNTTLMNGQICPVTCNFTGTLGTQNGRAITFIAYDNGAHIVI